MIGQMTPEQVQDYCRHLKRLGKIIHRRIYEEMKRAQFIDAFSTLGEEEMLTRTQEDLEAIDIQLNNVTFHRGLERIIRELRDIEYMIQTIRQETEKNNDVYYDIELAEHLVNEGKRRPESTTLPLPPWRDMQLPEVAGIGGKRKKTRKGGRPSKKKTRKQRR